MKSGEGKAVLALMGLGIACGKLVVNVLLSRENVKPARVEPAADFRSLLEVYDRCYLRLVPGISEKERKVLDDAVDALDVFLKTCSDYEKIQRFCDTLAMAVCGDLNLGKVEGEMRFIVSSGLKADEGAKRVSLRACDDLFGVLRKHQQRRNTASTLV